MDSLIVKKKTSLEWLADILWPYDPPRFVEDPDGAWFASPDTTNPNILIPTEPVASRVAVRRYHDGFSFRQRVRSFGAESLMRSTKLSQLTLGDRRVKVEPASVSPIVTKIEEEMGVAGLCFAVSLARPKSNRKPILQLITRDGECIGWAKVGWNDHTRRLIKNEAEWLSREAALPLIKPSLLLNLDYEGRKIVVTTSVPPTRLPRRFRTRPPHPNVFTAIKDLTEAGYQRVTESQWWHSVTKAFAAATSEESKVLDWISDLVADEVLRTGAWHGDLTPWNMMTTAAGTQVIDWEFAAEDVPFGFDLLHFRVQTEMELEGATAEKALSRTEGIYSSDLHTLGIKPSENQLVWRLYLIELARRTLELRASGMDTDGVYQGPAALRRLTRDMNFATQKRNSEGSLQLESSDPEPPNIRSNIRSNMKSSLGPTTGTDLSSNTTT